MGGGPKAPDSICVQLLNKSNRILCKNLMYTLMALAECILIVIYSFTEPGEVGLGTHKMWHDYSPQADPTLDQGVRLC